MDEPKTLDKLFGQKIFRIPDYQRGYAWQPEQLKDFWEDLANLSHSRSHYTGVLTLNLVRKIEKTDKEFWLSDDQSYQVYHIVDGQQRLTTCVIFLQALVDFIKSLPANGKKTDDEIFLTDSLNVAQLRDTYLYKTKPTGDQFRTYKFGYTNDNPSDAYLRFKIFGEAGGGAVEETFYTLNLSNAVRYFSEQFRALYEQSGMPGLADIYRKLTKGFRFNEYVIRDEFDVFVAFETMNNRGKKLSDLELLKNRLIYLTTLYDEHELDAASRANLRNDINDAWKGVYHQLGRNKMHPLSDDEFLWAHWVMYFKYSRQTSRDYIRFLLDEQFTPKRILVKIGAKVDLEIAEEVRGSVIDGDEEDDVNVSEAEVHGRGRLEPTEIRDYVKSLKESALHWFNSFYPDLSPDVSPHERQWIDAINRAGMLSFRPLVMAALKSQRDEAARIELFKKIERYIFIVFRTTSARSNYRDSEYYRAARELDRGTTDLATIENSLTANMKYVFDETGAMLIDEFHGLLQKKFGQNGAGYYAWPALRYFLFEYEMSLLSESRHRKVDWSDLLKSDSDRISIEHIFPQTATDEWRDAFQEINEDQRWLYKGTLGNLLLLSASINSSLQNDSFEEKKRPKLNAAGTKIRNGYSDGSHSEIEVAGNQNWGPKEIRQRGIHLLKFMEKRWDVRFRSDDDREKLLFLGT